MLDHMLTGAPLPKDDDSGEEDAPRDRSEVDVAEQPVKMKQQQQQQQYSVRSKAPLPPSKRLAASKQRHVSPQQQRDVPEIINDCAVEVSNPQLLHASPPRDEPQL